MKLLASPSITTASASLMQYLRRSPVRCDVIVYHDWHTQGYSAVLASVAADPLLANVRKIIKRI